LLLGSLLVKGGSAPRCVCKDDQDLEIVEQRGGDGEAGVLGAGIGAKKRKTNVPRVRLAKGSHFSYSLSSLSI
jgi:hypothetical protein